MNNIIGVFPLNDTQKWLLGLDPVVDAVTYTGVKINGKIDTEKLEKVLNAIVERHDALRMVVEKDESGTYVNKLVDEFEVKLNTVKLSDGTTEEKEKEMIEIIDGIGDGICKRDGIHDWKILFNFTLFDFGNDEYVLLATVVHLVTDGVSNTIFLNEAIALYNGAELAPVTKSFSSALSDYSELKNSEEGQKLLEMWKERIKNYNESFIQFSKDGHGHREPFNTLTVLPLDEISAFTKKNKMSNADLTMFLYHLAVASVFGTDFTMINSGNSNRTIATRSTVGCIVSSDVTTLELDDDKTIAGLLENFRERNKAKERNSLTAHFALDTSFLLSYLNYYNAENVKAPFGKDATAEPYSNIEFPKFWSYFAMLGVEAGDQLLIRCGYDPEVFTPEILEKFAACMNSGLKCLTEESGISFREFRAMN